jgi:transcriptional regulator with XRE-family HTH domain
MIGDRVRDLRLEANLTQEALGERAGLDRQVVNRVEQGHTAARIDTLIRLAEALKLPLRDLMPDDRPEQGGALRP